MTAITIRTTIAAALTAVILLASNAHAKNDVPMRQGLHQWPAMTGKVTLVVGSYQDALTFRRTYTFYYKSDHDEMWNQVPVLNNAGHLNFTWNSAVGSDVTLSDAIVVSKTDGIYFVVADKRVGTNYQDKGDITVTWNKLITTPDDHPEEPPYLFKPVFKRNYPASNTTIEVVLSKESNLRPSNN